jgi:fumarylacetoacetase
MTAAPTTAALDDTHDASLHSWVESANAPDTDFPVQNLPFGRFRVPGEPSWRIGVAIGEQVLDLAAAGLVQHGDMNTLMQAAPAERRVLRHRLSRGLRQGAAEQAAWTAALRPMSAVQLGLPCDTRDYTDFYVGIHHATAVGKLFRPDNPLLPNYKWVPIGYHGRASTLVPSGTAFQRPCGQVKPAGDGPPVLGPSARLDHELEMAIYIGQPNAMGDPVPIERAEEHVFGLALFNDWSARDLQAWEYQPLGPFLSKSFASTVSPWIVTLEALAPFRKAPLARGEGDPAPLPYLDSAANRAAGAFDIALEVRLQTAAMRSRGEAGATIARSNFADAAYWTVAQLVAHHSVNGCALAAGDLLGSGTLSGPSREQSGSLLELSNGGKESIALPGGESRRFLEDGDAIEFRGRCERAGFRSIGFGSCIGQVLPARQAA